FRTKFYGHANVEAFDSVLSVEISGAGENLLLVFQNGLDHFCRSGRWRVVGTASLEILHNLGAPVASALHQLRQPIRRDQFSDWDSGNRRIARKRHHSIPMSSQDEGGDVFDADLEFVGDEGAEAGGVEDASHADHALAREAAELVGGLGHGVKRI